jgi:activating signal cointegrator 1
MKALTICQPYAQLIAAGEKLVENRTWQTHYRGPLLIHAGVSRAWLDGARTEGMAFGAIVAAAELVDCLHIDRIKAGVYRDRHPWLEEHPHAHGPWCWVLADVTALPNPVSTKGSQGLWEYREAIG